MEMAGFLLFLLLAIASSISAATAISATTDLPARRSRFMLVAATTVHPPQPSYDCSKKSAEVCLVPGSAAPSCCGGQCVDTVASAEHCAGCSKACKHGRMCCGGHCVDLLSDEKNCGSCFNQCDKKCNNGFCDYAQ